MLRVAVFALMAVGLGGFGVVAWLATRPNPEAPAQIAVVLKRTVIAAAGPLRGGTLLKPENLSSIEIAAPPPGTQDDTPAARTGLTGAMLRHSLNAGEPILASDVLRPGDHGFLAAVLGPNMRAASVAVDNVSGSAGLIWPGDRVDLILTQTLGNPSLPAGRRVAAETVVTNVRVIAIDQLMARGVAPSNETVGSSANRTITLEVPPSDAEKIAVAIRLGSLSLAVRSAEAPETVSDQPANLPQNIQTTWGGDVSPALGRAAPVNTESTGATLRLFRGSSEDKEFKF